MPEEEILHFEDLSKVPKPLLHVHLEGSLTQETVLSLVEKYDVSLPYCGDREQIALSCRPGDWNHFRLVFRALCALLRTPSDISAALLALRKKLATDHIDYVEVHCTAWKHLQRGIPLDLLGEALIDGASGSRLPITRLIIDLNRHPDEPSKKIVEWLISAPRNLFVGLGVSGGPDGLARANYSSLCHLARDSGLGIAVHAGELEAAESVKESVEHLSPDRIVHGVTILDDVKYAAELARKRMHLEICPTANRRLGVGKADGSHIRKLLDLGFEISINTDDELIFNTSLPNEFSTLINSGVITVAEGYSAIANARKAAFAFA